MILNGFDAQVGYDLWAQISNPDVFVIHMEDDGRRGFRRVWPDLLLAGRNRR